MSRWGCIGLLGGSLLGLLLLLVLALVIRPTTPVVAVQPAAAPDLTLFLSERSASRVASQTLGQAVAVNFEPGGRVILTTSVNVAGLEPIADLGLSLERQGNIVVSQLHWLQVGFLRVPATWLPPQAVAWGTRPGEQITAKLPPQFTLVGLSTSADGVTLQLDLTEN